VTSSRVQCYKHISVSKVSASNVALAMSEEIAMPSDRKGNAASVSSLPIF